MTLTDITHALSNCDSDEFHLWIDSNEKDLSDFIYSKNGKELHDLGFDHIYFHDVCNSAAYKQYQERLVSNESFKIFLNLLSNVAEKLAQIGMFSFAESLVIDLPESASKCRLEAYIHISLIEDIRVGYSEKLLIILDILDKSRISFDEGGVRQLIDVLVYFFNKAEKALLSKDLTAEYENIRKLFQNELLISKYPFLTHQIILDLLDGSNPFELYISEISEARLEPSHTIRSVFREINQDYFQNPNMDSVSGMLWGFSRKEILDEVLVRGRGDFSTNYGDITAKDKVMLYCYFNLKKHFFTSYAVFQSMIKSLESFFRDATYKPVFVDLGCGPMTSGLAIADLIHTETQKSIDFCYIGIDISNPMMTKAESFAGLNIFSKESVFKFVNNWNDVSHSFLNDNAGTNNPVFFNASYVFASTSLDAVDLAKYVNTVSKNFKNVFFIFQNPNREDRNVKYEEFKANLKSSTSILKQNKNIRYKASSYESSEDVSFEILKI